MSTRLGTAYIPIEGDWSGFERQLKARARGNTLGAGFTRMGRDAGGQFARAAGTAAKIGLAGLGASFVYTISKAADFESQLSSLDAVAGANARQMQNLRKQALEAGAATKFSALEAAQAQTELAKGGLTVKQIAGGGLTAALSLAAAGEMQLADAASTAVNAIKLFGLRGKDAMRVADGLATAANSTTADVSDFALALTQGGSAAKAAGLNFGETVAALEALAEIGVKGSDAGTSLKAALTHLAAPTDKALGLMDQLGIKLFDAHGNMKPLADVAGILRDALGGLTREQRLQAATTLAGTDGMRALLALFDAGPTKISKFERQLSKQGTAADVAKKKQDNLKGSLENLGGSVETLAISVGSQAIPTLKHLTDKVTGFTNEINTVLDRNDLTFAEKVNRIFSEAKVEARPWIAKIEEAVDEANVPEKIADAISAGTPVVVAAFAKAGGTAVKTFASAFAESDALGKLVLGGLLLKRMGGLPAFTALGTQAGTAMGTGMATGIATGGAGLDAKIKGSLAGAGLLGKRLLALDVALNLIDARGNPIVGAANTAHDLTFGIVPEIKYPTADERSRANIDRITGQLEQLQGDKDFRGLKRLAGNIRALAADARAFNNAKLGRTWDQLAAQAEEAAQRANAALGRRWTARIEANFRQLARSGNVNMAAIRNTVRMNMQIVRDRLGADTAAGRKAVARNFRLAAQEIEEQMAAGVISTRVGSRKIREYLRKAREALGLTRAQAEAIKNTGTLLNSEDRPGRSTILGDRGKKAAALTKRRRTPGDRAADKKAAKTAREKTSNRRGGGIGNADVDTLHVNRLVVDHADGVAGRRLRDHDGSVRRGVRSRRGLAAADRVGTEHAHAEAVAQAVARARKQQAARHREAVLSLASIEKFDENGVQLFQRGAFARTMGVRDARTHGTAATTHSGGGERRPLQQTNNVTINGVDIKQAEHHFGRVIERRTADALAHEADRRGG